MAQRISQIWNELPPKIVNFVSLQAFKTSLNRCDLRKYILDISMVSYVIVVSGLYCADVSLTVTVVRYGYNCPLSVT